MLEVARTVQLGLSHDDFVVKLWTDGVFQASGDAITGLVAAAAQSDFGILVLGPDDTVVSRGSEQRAPRDNVVFELGLFMGSVGRNRTLLVKPRKTELRLPTDLLGLIPLEFDPDTEIEVAMAPICTQLRSLVASLGVR